MWDHMVFLTGYIRLYTALNRPLELGLADLVQSFNNLALSAVKQTIVFYKYSSSNQCIYLAVFVDDTVIKGDDCYGIKNLKQH